MENLLGFDLKPPQRFLEDTRGRFVRADLARHDDVFEQGRNPKLSEDLVKPEIEIGDDTETKPGSPQILQKIERSRLQTPNSGKRELLIHRIEESVEWLDLGAGDLEGSDHDCIPPAPSIV